MAKRPHLNSGSTRERRLSAWSLERKARPIAQHFNLTAKAQKEWADYEWLNQRSNLAYELECSDIEPFRELRTRHILEHHAKEMHSARKRKLQSRRSNAR